MGLEFEVIVGTGKELTVTVTLVEFEQPLPSTPETVYMLVRAGVAVTVVPVVALRPLDGDHVYRIAPKEVSDTEPPAHTAGAAGVIRMEGNAFTFKFTELLAVQPLTSVPTTL
jgi:hypothetical protein